jgi:hypothetical protein
VCGANALPEQYRSERPDGAYEVTIWRCPNNARKPTRTELLVGKKLTGHPIHKTEVRIENVPRLTPEKLAELKARIEAAPITKQKLSLAIGKTGNYVNTMFCRGDVSEEGLALIERKLEELEQPTPELEQPTPERQEAGEQASHPCPPVPEAPCEASTPPGGQPAHPLPGKEKPCPYELAKQLEEVIFHLHQADPDATKLVDYAMARAAQRAGIEW